MNTPGMHFSDAPVWPTDAAPIPGAIDGAQAHLHTAFASRDGTLTAGTWRVELGHFFWDYGVDEWIHVVSGEAWIRDCVGKTWAKVDAGSSVFFHKGARAEWIVTQPLLKKWVILDAKASLARRVVRKLKKLITRSDSTVSREALEGSQA